MRKIDYHLDGYSVEVNNCLIYNLAGAVSYYDKKYLLIYCAFWGLYSNWVFKNDEDKIKIEILKKLGLQSCKVNKVSVFSFINTICNILKRENPIIFYVSSSTIYYLNSYKQEMNYINHSIIIDEIDEKLKICHVRENSINKEMITMLTNIQPFSDYIISFSQLKKFYKNNRKLFGIDYNNYCLEFIDKTEDRSLEYISQSFVNDFIRYFKKENDILLDLLDEIEETNFISDMIFNEQIHRTIIHAMKPMLDFLGECYILNIEEYLYVKNEFINSRNLILKNLCKQKQKGNSVDINKIKELKEKIALCYEDIFRLITNAQYNNKFNLMKNYVKDIFCDSENSLFPIKNLLNIDDFCVENSVWKSDDKTEKHWILIELKSLCMISDIIIEHGHYENTITNSFAVYYFNDTNDCVRIESITDNYSVISHIKCNNINTNKIKILIDIPNCKNNFIAIIRRIKIIGEIHEK